MIPSRINGYPKRDFTSPEKTRSSSEDINMTTPECAAKLQKAIKGLPFGAKPTPNTDRVLKGAGQVVQRQAKALEKSPASLSEDYYNKLLSKASEKGEKSIPTVRSSPWASGVIRELTDTLPQERKRKLRSFPDLDHILKSSKGGGLHYLPRASEQWDSMHDIAESEESGAISAKWDVRKGHFKCSSIFSSDLSEEDIKSIWERSSVLCEYRPKDPTNSLLQSEIHGRRILLEKRSNKNAMITDSFYPIFRYITPEEIRDDGRQIPITKETTLGKSRCSQISISSDQVRTIAENILDTNSYDDVRYTNPTRSSVIIDIAKQVFGDPMRKGVYAEIPVSPPKLRSIQENLQTFPIKKAKVEEVTHTAVAAPSSSASSSSATQGSSNRSPERPRGETVIFRTPERR